MYLNILGIWAIGCVGVPSIDWRNAKKHIGSVFFGSLVAIILLLPILDYSIRATVETPIASANIWAQQYQMGIFLEEYYPDGKIAANDIGAINFLNSQHLVDLYGLATMRVLQEKWSGNWSRNLPDVLNSITKDEGAQIAVIYNSWFGYQSATGNASLPGSWIRVADWTIPNNVVCGGPTVTWYALRMEEVEKLRLSLSDFKPRLPPSVIVREYYSLP
jgi:hypothetical protein